MRPKAVKWWSGQVSMIWELDTQTSYRVLRLRIIFSGTRRLIGRFIGAARPL